MPAFPEVPWEKNRIWIWDAPTSRAASGSPTRSSTSSPDTGSATCSRPSRPRPRRSCCSPARSRTRDLLGPTGCRPQPLEDPPILVAWSDNGSEMTAIDTRQFMALMAIAQHHGRPGTPTDQAHIESFFSHLKGDWPHLTSITDPAALDTELARIRSEYNTVRLHASIGYVTPDDEHHGRGPGDPPRPRRRASSAPAPSGSSRIEPASHDRHRHQPRQPPAPASAGRRVRCARGSPAGTDAGGTGHGRRPEQHPPTRPTTSLSVGLKKSAALSKAQIHRIGPGNSDRVQLPGQQQPDEVLGVTTIGLDPIPRARAGSSTVPRPHTPRDASRRLAREPVPSRTSLIRSSHRTRQPAAEPRRPRGITAHREP